MELSVHQTGTETSKVTDRAGQRHKRQSRICVTFLVTETYHLTPQLPAGQVYLTDGHHGFMDDQHQGRSSRAKGLAGESCSQHGRQEAERGGSSWRGRCILRGHSSVTPPPTRSCLLRAISCSSQQDPISFHRLLPGALRFGGQHHPHPHSVSGDRRSECFLCAS